MFNNNDALNSQIDTECRKTANLLMYALENDKQWLFVRKGKGILYVMG